jgi:hypothetical protein
VNRAGAGVGTGNQYEVAAGHRDAGRAFLNPIVVARFGFLGAQRNAKWWFAGWRILAAAWGRYRVGKKLPFGAAGVGHGEQVLAGVRAGLDAPAVAGNVAEDNGIRTAELGQVR